MNHAHLAGTVGNWSRPSEHSCESQNSDRGAGWNGQARPVQCRASPPPALLPSAGRTRRCCLPLRPPGTSEVTGLFRCVAVVSLRRLKPHCSPQMEGGLGSQHLLPTPTSERGTLPACPETPAFGPRASRTASSCARARDGLGYNLYKHTTGRGAPREVCGNQIHMCDKGLPRPPDGPQLDRTHPVHHCVSRQLPCAQVCHLAGDTEAPST